MLDRATLDRPNLPRYRLFPQPDGPGPCCDERGAFVAGIPLLKRRSGGSTWEARPAEELNPELGKAYDAPIDVSQKLPAIERLARSLNEGDQALACILLVQMRFPEIPPLTKSAEDPALRAGLLALLWHGGLLKGEWHEEDHPRSPAGTREGGRFVPKDKPADFAPSEEKQPRAPGPRPGQYTSVVGQAIRQWARGFIERWGAAAMVPYLGAAIAFLEAFKPTETNRGEDKALAEMKSFRDPPKPLEDLYKEPSMPDRLGYQPHHIVEQNPENVKKFGKDRLDSPENIVWIPAFKHEEISGYYSKKVPSGLTRRESISQEDWDTQFKIGVDVMRAKKVLK